MTNYKHIYLSIDDNHVGKWYQYINFFKDNNVKVTFFLSHLNGFTEENWNQILELKENGHSIQFHGLNHLRAGVCDVSLEDRKQLKKVVHEYNWLGFYEEEIKAGWDILRSNGIVAEHYSYPMGNRTDETDVRLLKIFKSLKRGGCGKYAFDNFPKVYGSVNYGKRPTQYFSGHERILKGLKDGEVATLFMHEPVQHRLNELVKYGYQFVTIEELVK